MIRQPVAILLPPPLMKHLVITVLASLLAIPGLCAAVISIELPENDVGLREKAFSEFYGSDLAPPVYELTSTNALGLDPVSYHSKPLRIMEHYERNPYRRKWLIQAAEPVEPISLEAPPLEYTLAASFDHGGQAASFQLGPHRPNYFDPSPAEENRLRIPESPILGRLTTSRRPRDGL